MLMLWIRLLSWLTGHAWFIVECFASLGTKDRSSRQLRGDERRTSRQTGVYSSTFYYSFLRPAACFKCFSPLMQNAGVIAGMMQKVNPFKSAQPKVCKVALWWHSWIALILCVRLQDVHPLQNELLSSEGSLSENNNLPEKQVHIH